MDHAHVTDQAVLLARMLIGVLDPTNASLQRAMEKAAPRLFTQRWEIGDDGMLHIQSFKTPGVTRQTDGQTCDCLTRRGVCWHAASWRILCVLAAASPDWSTALHHEAPPQEDAISAEEFPGNFLGDFPPPPAAPEPDWDTTIGASYSPPDGALTPGPRVDPAQRELDRIEEAALTRRIQRLLGPEHDLNELQRLADELL